MTIDEIKKSSLPKLKVVSPTPILEIDLIIAHELNKDQSFVYSSGDFKLSKTQIDNIVNKVTRRSNHEPLAYIIEEKEFYGNKFKVTSDVLIPRIETEFLVAKSLEVLEDWQKLDKVQVIDIGTGSGCIIISIVKDILIDNRRKASQIEFIGSDISNQALEVAKENALSLLDEGNLIKFLNADLLSNHEFRKRSLIIANLPYIPSARVQNLSQEVQNEPKLALNGGKTGTDLIFKLIRQVLNAKLKHFVLLMEIEEGQADLIKQFINNNSEIIIDFEILKDIFGIDRFVKISSGE